MNYRLLITGDGSHSLHIEGQQVSFHSIHGAVAESRHVFISAGLYPQMQSHSCLRIFEMGFGTGLNALLTMIEAEKRKIEVEYCAIDAYPLDMALLENLNYPATLDEPGTGSLYRKICQADWGNAVPLSAHFKLTKIKSMLQDFIFTGPVHLVYFDAFAPEVQPGLWTREIFAKIFGAMMPGGTLVTYCAKGQVRRNLRDAGFFVEKLPGLPPKREMTRAGKPI